MERNPNDNLNSQGFEGGAAGSGSGSGSFGASGGSTGGSAGTESGTGGFGGSSGLGSSGSQGYGAGISGGSGAGTGGSYGEGSLGGSTVGGSFGSTGSGSFGGGADTLADKAKGGLGTAKEKASDLKATLADKLEAGANKLRQQQGGYASASVGTDGGSASVGTSGNMSQVNDRLATGLQGTADFIRNADIDSMKQGIEKQVKENPGRTLLIAAGLGYLLGKAFRK